MKKTAKKPMPKMLPKAPPVRSSAKLWGLAALCFVVAGGTWAILEFVVWNNIPSTLVGKWEVTGGPQDGATFDFFRSGKMIGRLNDQGMLRLLEATVRVEDGKIYSTTRHPRTGEEKTTEQTIVTLSAHEFIVEDQSGVRTRMRRAD